MYINFLLFLSQIHCEGTFMDLISWLCIKKLPPLPDLSRTLLYSINCVFYMVFRQKKQNFFKIFFSFPNTYILINRRNKVNKKNVVSCRKINF